MLEIVYDPKKLTIELQTAGLPVAGVSSAGRIDYSRKLTAAETRSADAIIAAHDPSPNVEESKLEAYKAAGISIESMVFALWDQIINGDSTKTAELKTIMDAIDSKIN
ncbi:MAG: hypothetical protein MUO42_09440 [Anaerolineaceae bacterium]|nr:hypothetical protein [Anaerolineaceae bacterium]